MMVFAGLRGKRSRHIAAFKPVSPETLALFIAVLSGDFSINGFRNRDLQQNSSEALPQTFDT
uniref:Uncharacterized protein n=1 Tax=Candidatus Kentrum sp. MB TaxID=2138164 RepID=A0A450XQH9_9GAMM|nr:MAG: hypothetical protein BECKMB1821G_GA0114241_108312 [Candidatus Kentron sp. MB]VFK34723.1 MAG: hypothetical protein BECKMB1821I_GA0114274_10821 [Candidatus Kentron sp. MB]VFK76907.1 MAG: hypothetical protein BECKMB1821H_GA0114242_10831 [Candidatus Kentron sp. MB]